VTALDLITQIRANGGSVELENDRIVFNTLTSEAELLALNRAAVKDALRDPNRWPCRKFASHPTTPTLPCKVCGEGWSAHPPDLRRPYDRVPLLAEAAAIVAAAVAEAKMERAS
jgi:hypothetical protein